jgi:6,7-dimethyl-8-ribityllumazine synthase
MQRKNIVKDRGLKMKDAARCRIGIVVADFNADITDRLLKGALQRLNQAGLFSRNITVVHVPGSFEIPFACQSLAKTKRYDALIALGAVIKGETDHYYYIADGAACGIMDVMLKHHIPIGFGVLTVGTLTQALERSENRHNAGIFAAQAVLSALSI